ncbi:tetratricopeptide repeat protein [uncultured Desulfuromonas sp.]|uniref:tetratricopeptide repeat protein n=1 Tax=uncultured Desulfuromonas sp. TaxID=181013 RepID=UPI002AAB9263|nr:tetratricopeptide repeat protein [uncultured Desulfuromonas sp.]
MKGSDQVACRGNTLFSFWRFMPGRFFLVGSLLLLMMTACSLPPKTSPISADEQQRYQRGQAYLAYADARLHLIDGDVDAAIEALQRAVTFDDQSPYLFAALASIHLDRGQTQQAQEYLNQALALQPHHLTSELMLADVYHAQGKTDQAVAAFRQVLDRHPDIEDVYLHISRLYLSQQAYDNAEQILRQWLNRQPQSINGLMELANLYRLRGDHQQAITTYRQAIELNPHDRRIYLPLGRLLEQQRQFDEALTLYDEAARQTDDQAYFDHLGSTLLIEQGRYSEALQRVESIVQHDPADVEALGKLGYIYIELERWPEAEATFRQALPYHPVSSQLFYWLAYALEHQQRWTEAIQYYQLVEHPSALQKEALVRMSVTYNHMNDQVQATETLEQLLELDQSDVRVFLQLANLYQRSQRYDKALAVLDRGIQRHPNVDDLYYSQGVIFELRGLRERTEQLIREALTLNPQHVGALNHLAYIYAESGEHLDEALEMACQAARLAPHAAVLDTLGWVYFQRGDYEQAREPLEQALKKSPEDVLIMEHLGDLYRKLLLTQEAQRIYRKVLELQPDLPDVVRKLQDLEP